MKHLMLSVLAVLMFSLFLPAAHADSTYTVTAIVGFQGGSPVPQTLDISYTVDLTTGVISNYSLSETGPLGSFTGGGLLPYTNWLDSEGDLLQLDLDNIPSDFYEPPPFLSPGTSYPAGWFFDIVCNGFFSTCEQDFGVGLQPADSGTLSASEITPSVPEPRAWMLILAGIAIVGLLKFIPSLGWKRYQDRKV